MEAIISFAKLTTIWSFNTKLVLIFSDRIAVSQKDVEILLQFSNAGLFNVAILLPKTASENCSFIYHNPFTNGSTFFTVDDPRKLDFGFPNKVRNLHGHRLNLIVYDKPPQTIVKSNGRVDGLRKYLFDILLSRWNATYRYVFNTQLSSLITDLHFNLIPFYSSDLTSKYDVQPAYYNDQVRIMVKNKRIENVTFKIFFFFLNPYGRTVIVTFLVAFSLYWFVMKRSLKNLDVNGVEFYGILLRQSMAIRKMENVMKNHDCVFFASLLVFAFVKGLEM